MSVDPGSGGFWDFGQFEKNGQSKWENPWAAGERMAPFDQEVSHEIDLEREGGARERESIRMRG